MSYGKDSVVKTSEVPDGYNPFTGRPLKPPTPITAPQLRPVPDLNKMPAALSAWEGERRALKPLSAKKCKCGRARVPEGQNVCRKCQSEANKRYRTLTRSRTVISEFQALVEVVHANLLNNPDTRAIYEHRHGQIATCVLKASPDHPFRNIRVIVVAFLPGKLVRVQGEDDPRVQLSVHLNDLERDDRKPEFRPGVIIPGSQKRDLRLLHALLEGKPVKGLVIASEAERLREAQLRAKWTPLFPFE